MTLSYTRLRDAIVTALETRFGAGDSTMQTNREGFAEDLANAIVYEIDTYLDVGSSLPPALRGHAAAGVTDLYPAPTRLWPLNGSKTESINGTTTSLGAGTERYKALSTGTPDMLGLDTAGSAHLTVAADAALRITGDLTVMFLTRLQATPSGNAWWVMCHVPSLDTLASNVSYALGVTSANRLISWSESGSGGDDQFDSTADTEFGMPLHQLAHVAMTRSGSTLKFFVQGVMVKQFTTTLPTGGTDSVVRIGGVSGAIINAIISSVYIKSAALTDEEVEAAAHYCLYGVG